MKEPLAALPMDSFFGDMFPVVLLLLKALLICSLGPLLEFLRGVDFLADLAADFPSRRLYTISTKNLLSLNPSPGEKSGADRMNFESKGQLWVHWA